MTKHSPPNNPPGDDIDISVVGDRKSKLLDALQAGDPTPELLKLADELAADCYWRLKDAEGCDRILGAAIDAVRRTMPSATDRPDAALLAPFKTLLYNRASFGWLGWDEPGIVITPAFERAAIESARAHFDLAQTMDLAPLKRSRAHWLLGALLIQANEIAKARPHFERAKSLANEAQEAGEAQNAHAFMLLCDVLLRQPQARRLLRAFVAEMKASEIGAKFADQAPTAMRVFGLRRTSTELP